MTSVLLVSIWKPCATYGLRLGTNLNIGDGTASAAHQLCLGVRRQLTVQTTQSALGMVERRIHVRDCRIRPAPSETVAPNDHEMISPLPVRFGRVVPIGGQVHDRRLVSRGGVSVGRKSGGYRIFRNWRGCRLIRVSSGWRARHDAKAWQVFSTGGTRNHPSGACRRGPG